jgi:splicing factor 1
MNMNRGGFDSEYASLMAELGEGAGSGADPTKSSWSAPSMGHDITAGGSNIPPWRRPEVWLQPTNQQSQQGGYRPPQPGYGVGYGAAGYPAAGAQWAGYQQGAAYQQPQDYANYASYYQGQYAQQAN